MMRTNKHSDYWTMKARKLGYPARSIFKLEEIQTKWHPIQKNKPVLDIGASPGSWTLFVLRLMGANTRISAVDLKALDITPPENTNFRFLQGDIFSPEAADFLQNGGPYGCILSDAAPSTSGNRLIDTSQSFHLVTRVIDLAREYLSPGGNLVVKVFQGGDEKIIQDCLKKLFKEVKLLKPEAVRKQSMEIYMTGLHRLPTTKKP